MSYVYNPGDPVTVLNPLEPADTDIVGSTADESLKQIKAYLKDPTVGPEAKYAVLKAQFDSIAASVGSGNNIPPGFIFPMGCSASFTGWLLCDGSLVSRSTYAALFAVIGINFGIGDGTTTFALPTIKGKIPVARDLTFATNSEAVEFTSFGSKVITLTTNEMASHKHKWTGGNHKNVLGIVNAINTYVGPADDNEVERYSGSFGNVYSVPGISSTTQSTGGGGSHNNLMRTLTVNYFIKT